MIRPYRLYLSLGSNQDNRFEMLQKASQLVFKEIGTVNAISNIYETPALGFVGADFLNLCMEVLTFYEANEVLLRLLQIEKDLGRERDNKKGYSSRSIDIDILFYDELVIASKNLSLPHPRLQDRLFVLKPLSELNSDLIHPVLQKSIKELEIVCDDSSSLKIYPQKLTLPSYNIDLSSFNYIAIEGNIGAGKTTLASMMSVDFNARLILERFADNPFLPKFYEDPKRFAFTLEMSFLADRYQRISDDLSQLDLFSDFIVSDYDIYKSLIFSKITLEPDEFKLYRTLFKLMYKDIAVPDLYIYLYQSSEQLKSNIKKRGRDYEQQIELEYLEKINSGYLEFLKSQKEMRVKIIDITSRDFVSNRSDYFWLLNQIASKD
ncbi:MAG: 2-amino-4-hydroxy-6-hydroxymethyldihydropteridine diphosphokinase [Flavobacteriaceae bacterium]